MRSGKAFVGAGIDLREKLPERGGAARKHA
jgi:hypothetical protein